MGTSGRIEQVIDDIYEFIESCKMQPLSQTKIIVPKDEMYDLLDELKLRMPDEIKRYQKIIANRDALIADAEEKAEVIKAQAREHANQLVSENEISRQAYEQANAMIQEATARAEAILREANEEAEQLRYGALSYTNEILGEAERVLSSAYEATKLRSEELVGILKENLEVVLSNRSELNEQLNPQAQQKEQSYESSANDDFDFDENTFLQDVE
ncbi:MAG: ATPase [Lachnospiraceae bacterium]|nr:ATPase [Lachnospiraceae bacterium]